MPRAVYGLLILTIGVSGCSKPDADNLYGATLTVCQSGAKVNGRINYTGLVDLDPSAPIVVQYSKDNFASTRTKTLSGSNRQGLLTFSFDISSHAQNECPVSIGDIYYFRAFQDSNRNGVWDAGEPAGRDDGSPSGHYPHNAHRSGFTTLEATGLNIYLDTTSGQ